MTKESQVNTYIFSIQDSDEIVDTEGSMPVGDQSELSDWMKVR